jgi:N-acetylmuramoyl-L-alanine amidase
MDTDQDNAVTDSNGTGSDRTVGQGNYVVQQGDCMSSIAYENGFSWETLWNHADNAQLKQKRKNPNVLLEGDLLTIPPLTLKQVAGATEKRHRFKRKGVPEKLRIKLLDEFDQPRANLDYIIVIDGDSRRGKTNGGGELIERIPPGAREGKLILGEDQAEKINLNLGSLDPVSAMSGVKARLANLGFYRGAIDGTLDKAALQALRDFQTKQGLQVTGAADDATRQKLLEVHGH